MRAFRRLRADRTRRLTAAEIRSARFGQSPMAWRGYSEEEVADFLARVAAGVEADEAERAALRAEIDRLRHFYREHGTDVDRVPLADSRRPPASPGDLTSQVRQRLDALTANAERYADLLTGGIYRAPHDPVPARDEARDLLVHAEVSGRIGFEQTVADFRSAYRAHPAGVAAELARTRTWLEEFTHALTRQVAALYDAVEDGPEGRDE
ncbi:MAG: DivIVA domain-containing protein [Mycobacteriales bacterium]